jgi:Ca2+-binding RTX toxin-like protein
MSPRAELRLLAALALLAVLLGTAADNHGVDAERRYIYKDSSGPFAPAIDPEPATDPLTFVDPDEGTVDVDLPFAFDLFDVRGTEVTIGVNGVVAFEPGADLPGANPDLASLAGPDVAAPWWDDWELGDDGGVFTNLLGPAADQTFVVRWHVRPAGGGAYVDFELLLREAADLIEFQYVDSAAGGDGATGSIGLSGFEYAQDEVVLDDEGFSIRWTPLRCFGRRATRVGTFGNDSIVGTPGRDVIVGLSGNDRVWAKGGHDIVCGRRGADRLDGGIGPDELFGEGAVDVLLGGNGADVLVGGAGRDRVLGGRGYDRCFEIGNPSEERRRGRGSRNDQAECEWPRTIFN